jgi:hypothetical protein
MECMNACHAAHVLDQAADAFCIGMCNEASARLHATQKLSGYLLKDPECSNLQVGTRAVPWRLP